jgi:hypothetical protein
MFFHETNPASKGQHIISNDKICLRFYEADFDSDEEMFEAIDMILKKLNA